ncbi:MAG: 50S ribosomal protein L11 methyltransferase [Eubacteriales bacterium]|nr:50S ribosomal protein L11 methyltransferase [Eubacteriales bacterium]
MDEGRRDESCLDWKEVTIYTTTAGVEPVAALLEENGVEGYVLEDAADFQEFLKDTEIYWDYVDEGLVREKTTQETCLKIYLPDDDAGAAQLAGIRGALENLKARDAENAWGRLCFDTGVTRQQDWEWGWKQYFKPFPVGRTFLIKPSWETVEDAGGRRILEIDPASSFGTGSHDTTQLCMAALEACVKPGDKLLDMGTGSGILAIAAAMLGAEVRAVVDIDENCLKTARENAEKNRVSIGRGLCGDALRNDALAREIGDGYDIIVANIVADVIIGMAPMFFAKLAPGGTLICSGILNERADEVRAALEASGLSVASHESSDDWSAFVARK